MKKKLLLTLLAGIIIGGITGYVLKPRKESPIERNDRISKEWVNNPNHFLIKWEDGKVDSVYSFEKCPGASVNSPFVIRIGDWQHMKVVKPTSKYTVEKL